MKKSKGHFIVQLERAEVCSRRRGPPPPQSFAYCRFNVDDTIQSLLFFRPLPSNVKAAFASPDVSGLSPFRLNIS